MSGTRINVSLEHCEIGLTGAIPDRISWSEPAMDRAILEFVALFSSIVFKYGGRIIHGSHPTFTPVILRQARLHANKKRSKKPVTLVMSALWEELYSEEDRAGFSDVADLVVTKKVGDGNPDDKFTKNSSLTEMRRVLIERQNMMVAVGGKMHAQDGLMPGVLEEMDLAGKKEIPRFLIAGMGGYSAEYAKKLLPASLRNGLSDDENTLLFRTTDVSACVNLLFEKLAKFKRG
jgi:hypothetical protein